MAGSTGVAVMPRRVFPGDLSMLAAHDRPAAFWVEVWTRMCAEALAGAIFCDGSIEDAAQFAEMMNAVHVHPFCVFLDGQLAAVVWLTNLEGRMCRGHFFVFKDFWRVSRFLGSFVLRQLLYQKYEDGSYCFDVVVGMVPKINIRAINVAKKAGFVYCGIIPFGALIKEKNISVDMVVLSATREE
jgi:hypothetical protein